MTKEEKIKEAYGGLIDLSVLDENGWAIYGCEDFSESGIEPFGEYETKNHIAGVYNWRPKSLQGIENNNDWVKIESEEDLPKEKGLKCLFLCIHGNTTYISDDVLEDPKWFATKYSHWRLKDEIKYPIY